MAAMNDMMPEIGSADIGDARIQYLLYPGDGPTVILLHATGFLPWLWHPIARELSRSFRVIAPYFCDHRTAEPEEGGLNWHLLAEDLTALCKCLSIEHPFLAGHSMGATIIAIAHGAHGLDAAKMVMVEPIFLPRAIYGAEVAVDQHPLASRSIRRRNGWENETEAREYLRSKPMFARWDDEMLDLYIRYGMLSGDGGGLVLACHPRREAALFMGGLHFDPWPILPEIRCPVLVVEGETSENKRFIDLPKIASLIPAGGYHLVPDTGHLVPQERPMEVFRIFADFFS